MTGLTFTRRFSTETADPSRYLDAYDWEWADITLPGEIEPTRVEFPSHWSVRARRIVAQKYFRMIPGSDGERVRETSFRQVIDRVATAIMRGGLEYGYYASENDAIIHRDEIAALVVGQYMAFNSPVWFNVGVVENPAVAACYLTPIDDSMESIQKHYVTEGRIYTGGAGNGTNYSRLRGSNEPTSSGGTSSGPCAFITAHDAGGGSIKSGGSCLLGSQYVYTDTGPRTAEDLMNREFVAVSYDPPTRRFRFKRARCWKSGTKPCVWVTTDRGAFEMSSDHPVRLRDTGEYVRAGELRRGMMLHQCSDMDILAINLRDAVDNSPGFGLRVDGITPLGERTVYSIEVDCPTPDDKSPETGHNFVIWPRASRIGSGIVVSNTRRAAKMVILDADHPDVVEFVRLKSRAEDAASALIAAGFDSDFRAIDGAYSMVPNQNANHSVRVTDEFMRQAVEEPGTKNWGLTNRLDGEVAEWVSASEVLREIAAAAHRCGDPGMQFHDAIQKWNPCAAVDQIWTTNPCCFIGNTLVETSEGKIPIDELASIYAEGKSLPYVVAWDEKLGLPVHRQIRRAWKSGDATQLVRVTTVKGLVFFCTPEHPFLLRDGGWMDAKNLEPGTDLRAIDFNYLFDGFDDKVASCEVVENRSSTPVYDIEVDGVHNFSITTPYASHGIVVHNSEFVFLDNTSCNLSDFNVLKFFGPGAMDAVGYDGFKHAVRTTTVSMDILVEIGGYPTDEIDRMTRATRPLGLGITNLGGLLMSCGLPYDSDKGRRLTSEIVSTMSAAGWCASAEMAEALGAYELFDRCRNVHLSVIDDHCFAAHDRGLESWADWVTAGVDGSRCGYRNAQMSVAAPSGTRSFLLDCDTTGIEPAFALQTVKLLVGGGSVVSTLGCVRTGLRTLGYEEDAVDDILDRLAADGVLPVGDGLGAVHADVFRVAVPPPGGGDPIHWKGHIAMMEAIQPFISGAQSKTVSLPNSATVEDIMSVYIAAWRAGLKAISIYRNGCKKSQPLSSTGGAALESGNETESVPEATTLQWGERSAPERTRPSITTKFVVGGNKGYLTVGLYPDETPCEIFVRMAKEGSTISGLLDSWATAVSLAIQHGTPLETIIDKMIGRRFEPAGWTGEQGIPYAASVVDYIARWLRDRFVASESDESGTVEPVVPTTSSGRGRQVVMGDGPDCPDCHVPTVRDGKCHVCPECARGTGCAG